VFVTVTGHQCLRQSARHIAGYFERRKDEYKIGGHSTYDARTFWAGRRRAEAERTRHRAPHATQAVRYLCGSSSDGQSAFSDRHAPYGGPRGEIHWACRRGTRGGGGSHGSSPRCAQCPRCREAAFGIARQSDVSVATSGDVRDQPRVADAASELLQEVFGKEKNPCRLVYGVASLPLGTPVELEVIFEVG